MIRKCELTGQSREQFLISRAREQAKSISDTRARHSLKMQEKRARKFHFLLLFELFLRFAIYERTSNQVSIRNSLLWRDMFQCKVDRFSVFNFEIYSSCTALRVIRLTMRKQLLTQSPTVQSSSCFLRFVLSPTTNAPDPTSKAHEFSWISKTFELSVESLRWNRLWRWRHELCNTWWVYNSSWRQAAMCCRCKKLESVSLQSTHPRLSIAKDNYRPQPKPLCCVAALFDGISSTSLGMNQELLRRATWEVKD